MSSFVSQRISWIDARLPNAHPSQIFQSVRAVLNASKVSRSVVALPRSCASRLNIRAFSSGSRNLAFSGQEVTIQKEAKATRTVMIPSMIKILQSHGKGGVRRGFFIGSWKITIANLRILLLHPSWRADTQGTDRPSALQRLEEKHSF